LSLESPLRAAGFLGKFLLIKERTADRLNPESDFPYSIGINIVSLYPFIPTIKRIGTRSPFFNAAPLLGRYEEISGLAGIHSHSFDKGIIDY
jgi:hypothetical protein